jgi:hypothetical protein
MILEHGMNFTALEALGALCSSSSVAIVVTAELKVIKAMVESLVRIHSTHHQIIPDPAINSGPY